MKKVLYITTVSRTINSFLVPHIEMLLENGYKVDCATCIDKNVNQVLINKGVKIFNIPFSRSPLSFGNIKAFKELIKLQKENQYDIIHVHTPIASIYGRLLKLKFKNLKTIYTAHGYHFFKGGSKIGWIIYYPIEKLMAKLTDVTININKEDFEITKKKLKLKKAYLINGVGLNINEYSLLSEGERNKKRRALGLKDDDFVVIMIAELNGNKNQMQLVRAIELLKNKYQNIKCLIVGEGKKLQFLKKEVKKRSLEKNIVFLGFRKDVNELINASDIGVLFSYREGLPRNLMEIMANGKRIVATNIRGNRDIVCNKFIGALVEVNDYEATAKAIEKFYLTSANKNKILKEVERYSISNILTELSFVYDSLQEGGNQNEKMSSYIANE
ncbi:glycosyltransferase family 4 protein [Clostridium perfringens]|uniref:glycosyltransferase family 4 protein n=1 Tax=Clostridium perfringens TaxID=1502 RepID=UPI003AF4C369|nr:glycosyltransferase family 4 protein [Clostridium perfringens]MDK0806862.1 glycosyltransferase family 4 protein [Clostridium perfringens]